MRDGEEQMAATIHSVTTTDAAPSDVVFRKVFRRLIWFLFILLVVSFIDRINVAFAALTMNKELGLSATAFAMSITVFYVAYALFEVPSNLVLAKVGARLWIARIMITWALLRQQQCLRSMPGASTACARWSALQRLDFYPVSFST